MKKKIQKKLIIFGILILFFFPLNKGLAKQAKLRIAHNDGIQCYLNDQEFLNTLTEPQTERYWNKEIDVSNYLRTGQNLLACRVSNGDGNPGSGIGYFDVELIIDEQTIIQKGSGNWKYFGKGGSTNPPSPDYRGRYWYNSDFDDSYWAVGNTPFDGRRGPVLTRAPDDAWFRKFFNLAESVSPPANNFGCSGYTSKAACLSIPDCLWTGSSCLRSSLATCNLFNNETDCLSKTGCYWKNSRCEEYQDLYKIIIQSRTGCWTPTIHRLDRYFKPPLEKVEGLVFESVKPLITGLVKYGNQIEIFVDNQSIGKAVVKEGEYSGVSNFYFKPKRSIVSSTNDLKIHQLKIVATNPYDGSTCSTNPINFIVLPYPAPIIHRLGEIPYLIRANQLVIKTKTPLITGLVKYGSVVDIFIDDKLAGRAKVKEGEKSGTANFYFIVKNPLSIGEHTLYAIAKKAGQEEIVSAPSQVFNFKVEE
ncbi:MAG: hypothetical protein ACK413_01125 [Patescibacteria group bacterium]